MTKQLSRRNMLGQAGLALGGLVTLGALQGCGEDETTCPVVQDPPPDTTPKALEWPYQKHIPATFAGLDVAAVKAAAYNAYYNGGCCHGAYSALLGAFQASVGAPFDQLPLDFGKFGGGGVGGYGSICGAVLGSQLIVNMVVEDPPPPSGSTTSPNIRNAMIVELMRWYETFEFPEYVPTTRNAKEFNASGVALTVLNFDTPPESMRIAPGAHLCHASVTGWCTAQGVAANGPDKLARCARLTADVAGKAAELLNAYLASDRQAAFVPVAPSGATTCVTSSCHGAAKVVDPSGATVVSPPVASGMGCGSCHPGAHGF